MVDGAAAQGDGRRSIWNIAVSSHCRGSLREPLRHFSSAFFFRPSIFCSDYTLYHKHARTRPNARDGGGFPLPWPIAGWMCGLHLSIIILKKKSWTPDWTLGKCRAACAAGPRIGQGGATGVLEAEEETQEGGPWIYSGAYDLARSLGQVEPQRGICMTSRLSWAGLNVTTAQRRWTRNGLQTGRADGSSRRHARPGSW